MFFRVAQAQRPLPHQVPTHSASDIAQWRPRLQQQPRRSNCQKAEHAAMSWGWAYVIVRRATPSLDNAQHTLLISPPLR